MTMSTEEDRVDPSEGKSDASPSAPGTGRKSETVLADPDTRQPPDPGKLPQSSPVPDVLEVLEEGRKH